ncbi:hypothetical protein NQ318_021721 [Aromia moschata]|uniref:guanylate cyclase n=1 Tax=Aromia moschata TaxID=1265417 RepID=A0AAV8XYL5_9CUCU|nr:hypothetical protein NQ318_021721 [Aromia moschata]
MDFEGNRKMELVQLGSGFMQLLGDMIRKCGSSVTTYFEIYRPRSLRLSFDSIIKRSNTPFVLGLRKSSCRKTFPMQGFKLKGQMVYCQESDSLLFIGSPLVDGLEGLTGSGLFYI